MRLHGKSAAVTGGSSGIGRGIALALAEEGAAVTVGDLQADPKQGKYHDTDVEIPTHEAIIGDGGEAAFHQTDVSDPDDCRSLIEFAIEEFDGLDILVNNAGIHVPGTIEDVSIEDWKQVVEVNLDGQFYCAKFAVDHLKERAGSIINIASVHAIDGGAGPPYVSSKAGVMNLTKDLAVALGEANVNVNCICPGYIETPMQDYLTEEQIDGARERTLLPRFGTPADIGKAAVFLASEDGEWITGESLFVDGGWTAYR